MKSRTIKRIYGAIRSEGFYRLLNEDELLTIYYNWDWLGRKNRLRKNVREQLKELGYVSYRYNNPFTPGCLDVVEDDVMEICTATHGRFVIGRMVGCTTKEEAVNLLEQLWSGYKNAVLLRLATVPPALPIEEYGYGLKHGWEKDYHRINSLLMDPIVALWRKMPQEQDLDPNVLGWNLTIDLLDSAIDIGLTKKEEYLMHALGDYPGYTDQQIVDLVLSQLERDLQPLWEAWKNKQLDVGLALTE